MMKTCLAAFFLAMPIATSSLAANRLIEPRLTLERQDKGAAPRVAITLDACSGKTDERIVNALVDNRIPATIFVTGRWVRSNPATMALFKAHADLFEIENHGAMHVPAIDVNMPVYGLPSAGSAPAVEAEVTGGTAALAADGVTPHWFRGATAKYTASSIAQIRALGFRIAGYSVNGDGGSLLGTAMAERRIARSVDGDVIIAHINQPGHSAGQGVVKGVLDLKAKGYAFVRLDDTVEKGSDDTTN